MATSGDTRGRSATPSGSQGSAVDPAASIVLSPESQFISLITAAGLGMINEPPNGDWSDVELVVLRCVAEQAYTLLRTIRTKFLDDEREGRIGADLWDTLSGLLQDSHTPFETILGCLDDCTKLVEGITPLHDALLNPRYIYEHFGLALGTLASKHDVIKAMLVAAVYGVEGSLGSVPEVATANESADTTLVASPISDGTEAEESAVEQELGLKDAIVPANKLVEELEKMDVDIEPREEPRPRYVASSRRNSYHLEKTSAFYMQDYVFRWLQDTGGEALMKTFEDIALAVDLGGGNPATEEAQRAKLLTYFEDYKAIIFVWDLLRLKRQARYGLQNVVLEPELVEYVPTDADSLVVSTSQFIY